MEKIPAMVSMARDKEEKEKDLPCVGDAPDYPYGLCISLSQDELEKLGFEASDFGPGDIVHLHCLAMVTSVSESATTDSDPTCRVELQVTNIACESEDEENAEEDKQSKGSKRLSKMYI